MKDTNSKPKRGKWWRRILIIVALFLLIWIGIIAVLKWWFPSGLVMRQAKHIIRSHYGIDVEIQQASIDPFARFEFDGIAVSSSGDQPPVVTIKSIKLGYEFWTLVRYRQLHINQILVDSVDVDLRTLPDGSWNFETLLSRLVVQDTSAISTDSVMAFPVKIALDRIDVTGIDVSVDCKIDTLDFATHISPLNIRIRDFTGTSIDDLHGKAIISMPQGEFVILIRQPIDMAIKSGIQLACSIDIDSKIIQSRLNCDLLPESFTSPIQEWQPAFLPTMSVAGDILFDQARNSITVNPLTMSIDRFSFETEAITTLDTLPVWSAKMKPVEMDLSTIFKLLNDLKFPSLHPLEMMPAIAGSVSLDSLSMSGKGFDPELPDFRLVAAGGLTVEVPEIEPIDTLRIRGEGVKTSIAFAGEMSASGVTSGSSRCTGKIARITSEIPEIPITMDSLSWDINLSLLDNGEILQIQETAGIKQVLNGSITMASHAVINIPELIEQKPAALAEFTLNSTCSNLDVSIFGNDIWGGRISADFQLNADGTGRVDGSGLLAVAALWITTEDKRLDFPDLRQQIHFQGVLDVETQGVEISPLTWEWTGVANAEMHLKLQMPRFRAEIVKLHLDLPGLQPYLPSDYIPEINLESLNGIVNLDGWAEGALDNISGVSYELSMKATKLGIEILEPRTALSDASVDIQLMGGMQSVKGTAKMEIRNGGLVDVLPDLLKDISLSTDFQYTYPNSFRIDSLWVAIPSIAMSGKTAVNLDIGTIPPTGDIWFEAALGSPAGFTLWDTMSVSGITSIQGKLTFDSLSAMVNGEMQWSDVSASIGSMASIKHMVGRFPFSQQVNLLTLAPTIMPPQQMAHRALGLPNYQSFQPSYHWTMPAFGTITVDSVNIIGYGVSNISIDISWVDGYLEAPEIQCDAYGGNISGNLWVKVGGLHPDSIITGVQVHASSIQTSQLVVKSQRNPEESIICADADLTVAGIPSSENFDVSGSMDITRIGRSVALDLLQMMDPEGKDEGIQSTKTYLNQGWGVKMFSFAIRDGFVYSYMVPTAPPPSRLHMFIASKIVRLPPQITYGRIPLKFLMQMQTEMGMQ